MADVNARKIERYIDELYELYKNSNKNNEEFVSEGKRIVRDLERVVYGYLGDLRTYIKYYGFALVIIISLFCSIISGMIFYYNSKMGEMVPMKQFVRVLEDVKSFQEREHYSINAIGIAIKNRMDVCGNSTSESKKTPKDK